MKIQHFFDPDTFTLTYVVFDESTRDTVIIDPVMDFDPLTGKVQDLSLQKLFRFIAGNNLNVKGVLETHAHADHISGSQILKRNFPEAVLAIGERIKIVQEIFKGYFNLHRLKVDGSQFDRLLKDFEHVSFGSLSMTAIPTPGHTPACMTYLFEDAAFTGDSLFMPDYGTGRCDFPKGSAHDLYNSVASTLYELPDETRVFVGHDYSPNGREMRYQTTIGESKNHNIHLNAQISEKEFVAFRTTRDKTLKAPRLLLPSIQVNIAAGHLPDQEEDGKSYLKLPLTTDFQSAIFKNGIPTVTVKDLQKLKDVTLIDVRRPDEYFGELGHIDSTRLITLGPDLEDFLASANKDLKIVFICRSGARSGQATALALGQGFQNSYNMDGGMLAWRDHINAPRG